MNKEHKYKDKDKYKDNDKYQKKMWQIPKDNVTNTNRQCVKYQKAMWQIPNRYLCLEKRLGLTLKSVGEYD